MRLPIQHIHLERCQELIPLTEHAQIQVLFCHRRKTFVCKMKKRKNLPQVFVQTDGLPCMRPPATRRPHRRKRAASCSEWHKRLLACSTNWLAGWWSPQNLSNKCKKTPWEICDFYCLSPADMSPAYRFHCLRLLSFDEAEKGYGFSFLDQIPCSRQHHAHADWALWNRFAVSDFLVSSLFRRLFGRPKIEDDWSNRKLGARRIGRFRPTHFKQELSLYLDKKH